jgi:hypothetical protein
MRLDRLDGWTAGRLADLISWLNGWTVERLDGWKALFVHFPCLRQW